VNEGRQGGPGLGLIVLLGALSAFAPISIEMYLPALPLIAADLKVKAGAIELTISAFLVALSLGQLVYGPLSDRIGRRRPFLIGVTLYAVASTACALAVTADQLIAFRFLQALGGCVGVVLSRAVIRDLYPAEKVVGVLSTLSLVVGLAPLLAPLAGGAILKVASWRVILWVQVAFGAAALTTLALFLKETLPAPARGPARSVWAAYGAVLRNRTAMGYVLSSGLGGSVLFVYGACLPAIAMHRYGLTAQQLAWVLALGAGAMMACAQFNRILLRRWSRDVLLRTANAISIGLGVILCATAFIDRGGFAAIIIPMLLILALRGLSMPVSAAAALLAEDRHVGSISALIGSGAFFCGAVFSALPSRFADGTARPMALVMLAGLVLAAVVLQRKDQRPKSASHTADGALPAANEMRQP
jgi:DHA1 family bicyclomycin/chloramphenicol resistance-like MFS transporter